jgi:hypothetical protein
MESSDSMFSAIRAGCNLSKKDHHGRNVWNEAREVQSLSSCHVNSISVACINVLHIPHYSIILLVLVVLVSAAPDSDSKFQTAFSVERCRLGRG